MKIDLQSFFLENPSPLKLFALNKLFNILLPFNRPHHVQLVEIEPKNRVCALLPFKRYNYNHLKTMHACAIVLAGEFVAGVLLLGYIQTKQYRLIMKKLEVDYLQKATTDIYAICQANELNQKNLQQIHNLEEFLQTNDESVHIQLETTLMDSSRKNVFAVVKTTWHIKSWEKIRNKI